MEAVKLARWMRTTLFAEHKAGRVVRMTVHHVVNDKVGPEVHSMEVPQAPDEHWIEDATNDIDTITQGEADELGGVQRYCLLVYRGEQERASSRFPFRVAAVAEESLNSEPASLEGLLAQLMRHNEINSKTNAQAIGQVLTMQHRTIEEQGAQLRHLVSKSFEAIAMVEELASAKHERELSLKKAETQGRIMEDMAEKAMMLAPSIVNRIAGQKLLREKTTPEMETIKAVLGSLTPPQWDTILSALSPEQKIALGSLMEIVTKDPN